MKMMLLCNGTWKGETHGNRRARLAKYLLLFIIFCSVSPAFAAKRYWVAPTGKNWSTTNWSTTSGGASGSSAPGSNDTAYFDGNGVGNCTINVTANVKRMDVAAGYSGTIIQNTNTLTVGTGNAVFSGGTFTGGSVNITVTGSLTISGTAFTSTSDTLTVSGNFTVSSGSFTHNSGTTLFNTPNTITTPTGAGIVGFYHLSFNPASAGSYTIVNTIIANGTLGYGGTNAVTINTGTIDAKNAITISNTSTGGGGSATINISGTGSQSLTASSIAIDKGTLPHVTINKSSGTLTLDNAKTISVAGNWTYTTAGGLTVTGSKVAFIGTKTIAGTHTLNKVAFTGSASTTMTVSNTLTVNDSLILAGGSNTLTINTGTVDAKGHIAITNTGTGGGGSATINISGSGDQVLSASSIAADAGTLPHVIINKSAGLITLDNTKTISVAGNWTYTAADDFDVTGSKVVFIGTKTISGTHTLNKVAFTGSASTTMTVSNTLSVNDSLILAGGSNTLTINTGTINAKGHIAITNTGTGGGGSATINIVGLGSQTLSASNIAADNGTLPHVIINKSSGTLTLGNAKTISVAGNWTYTTAGGLTVTGSKVAFIGTKTISGTHTLNKVVFTGSASTTMTVSNTLTVSDSLILAGGSNSLTINTGTVNANGHIAITNAGTGGGGSATININGSGSQMLRGSGVSEQGNLPHVTINKSSGTLTLASIISAAGNWIYTAGTVAAGGSTVVFTGSKTITGSHHLNHVTFTGGSTYTFTIASGTILSVDSTLSIAGTGSLTFSGDSIHSFYNVLITNTGTAGGGTACIKIAGTGNQDFTGSGTSGMGATCDIFIDKPAGTLYLKSIINCAGNWAYRKGTVDAGTYTSTVLLIGTKNIDGQGTSSTMSFYKLGTYSSGTRTLTGNLDVDDNIGIGGSTTLSCGSYTMNLGGTWSNSGTWSAGTGTVIFDGGSYRKIIKAGGGMESFNNMTVNRAFSNASLTLNCPVKVTGTLTMTKGKVKTTATTAYLNISDNALVVGGHDSAYVHGPVRKTGNDTVWFPLGDTTLTSGAYHPLRISAPSSVTDEFEAQYQAINPSVNGYPVNNRVDSLDYLDSCEYWTLVQVTGSSAVTSTLGWNSNCTIDNIDNLRVGSWDGTKWADLGAGEITINWPKGKVRAQLSSIFVSGTVTHAIAIKKPTYRGYATLRRKLDDNYYEAYNSIWFKFDDEYNDVNHHLSYRVINASNQAVPLINNTNNLGITYYGDNRHKLDLYQLSNSAALPAGYYILEVTNEKNEVFVLRFKNN
ncbi:MAG: hypothetical protein FD123_634 [Bacteroidetes bacterium]|nr:MAG: hypothetical protein FD123_634 [Bacteroidota bacterium]